MRANKIELIAGGALVAISGAALATYLYKNSYRAYSRKFDKSSVEEVEGKVESVLYKGRENGEDLGVELLLKVGEELLPVHVGPAWYMDNQNERIHAGDKLKVRGSRVIYDKTPVMVAESITAGNKSFRLRDEDGHPLWSALKVA